MIHSCSTMIRKGLAVTHRRAGLANGLALTHRRAGFAAVSNRDTLDANKVAVIGGGNMAEAIIRALKISKCQDMSTVWCIEPNEKKCTQLKKKYKINTTSDIESGIKDADIVVLAIKPQNLEDVSESLENHVFPEDSIMISILAGCSIGLLKEAFPTVSTMVRTMPNTPASVMEGITLWVSSKDTSDTAKRKTRVLLRSMGEEVEVQQEKYLDMGTAISGSGPAYIFLMTESLVDAAVHLGFPRDIATRLAIATIQGSASYARQSDASLYDLRARVTSPGGTTASAMYELEKGGFRTVMSNAVWAAYRRSLELGEKNPNIGPGRNKF